MSEEITPSRVEDHDDYVESLAVHFIGHPGFMWTSGGFEILHADWPAYPRGHGLRAALSALADFPGSTPFYRIDSIDQCTLFAAGREPSRDPYDKSLFHVAIWDEDLREGIAKNLFTGPINAGDYIQFPAGKFEVTERGQEATLLFELTRRVYPRLFDTVEDLLYVGRYDSAVREAAILLENQLRRLDDKLEVLNGHRLIDAWCNIAFSTPLGNNVPNPARLEFRADLRRFFTYVRNEFAHNLSTIGVVTAARLLTRCSKLYEIAIEVAKAR